MSQTLKNYKPHKEEICPKGESAYATTGKLTPPRTQDGRTICETIQSVCQKLLKKG